MPAASYTRTYTVKSNIYVPRNTTIPDHISTPGLYPEAVRVGLHVDASFRQAPGAESIVARKVEEQARFNEK